MNFYKRTSRLLIPAALLFALWLIFLPTLAGLDTDIGDIAVIEADPTILQPGELFDLNNQTLTFTPLGGGGFTVSIGSLIFDNTVGTDLGLTDDGFASQALSFTFPFFGVDRTSVFINSNGNLTFGSGSTLFHFNSGGGVGSLGTDVFDILVRIATGLPRIAPLWQDWNPAAAGGVFANSQADRLIVTWQNVPLFGTSSTATFQVVLFDTGVIQMSYQTVPATPAGGYLTGISSGSSSQFLTTTIDFSQGTGSSISDLPNFEPLAQVFGSSSAPLVHISAVARRFFNTHGDDFDQMVMFANFTHALGTAFAFELTTRQTVSGIGLGLSDFSSFFGSTGQLQSFLNMNRLSLFPADPNTTFLGTNNTLDILGQESGHQWLAFVQFDNGGTCSNLLLGRALAHWSFFHDTDASDMEGNSWVDNGDGTFTTDEATERFSALDQYIMGLRSAAEVPSFFFINNPKGTGGRDSSSAPEIGVTVNGTRQNVTVSQIQTCEGARSPSSGFTDVNQTTTWSQAFILLIPEGTTAPSGDVTKIDTFRSAWVSFFNTNTDNRGTIDTSVGAAISVTPSSLNFGNVGVGSSSDLTFTVTNTGGGPLSGSASTSGAFSIVGSATYSLAASASTTITVRFSPTSLTTFLSNVTFTGDAGATRQVSGTGVRFTDDPLVAGVTAIKRVHITELRASANDLRAQGGLGSFPFTDPMLTVGVTTVKRVHITELRTALTEAAAALSKPAPNFPTDPTIVAGQTVIKAAHITELRSAVRDLDVFTLTVNKAGTGSGTVTSSPAGINCGTTCTTQSFSFDSGTVVTLTATPASSSTFAGFSGDADCSDGVVTMNASRTCTATFNPEILNISGTYAVTITVTSTTCSGIAPGDQVLIPITVSQTGQNLVFTDSAGNSLTGTLTGTSFTVTGMISEPVPGTPCVLTDTITWNGTVDPASLNFSGTATESIDTIGPPPCPGIVRCTINETLVGTRVSASQFQELKAAPGAARLDQLLQRLEIPGAPFSSKAP